MPGLLERVHERLPPSLSSLLESAREKEILLYAGGLAFYGLVSMAPFVVIGFWIAGMFVGEDSMRQLGENIDELMPAGTNVSGVVSTLSSVGTGVGITALLTALWPATAYGSGLVRAFDRISDEPERSLQGVRGRTQALLFVVLLPALLLGALAVSYLATGLFDGSTAGMVAAWALAVVAAFVTTFLVLSVIYVVFGPSRLPPRATATGAAAASAVLALMSLGYVVYLGQGADFEERVAGSGFASVVLLALWLYAANAVLLVGFTLARSCAGSAADPEEVGEEPSDRGDQSEETRSSDGASSSSSISSSTGSSTSSRR
jgi:membrane protein